MPQKLDAIIIGGGIAGLFTLAKLINRGYSAVLLEKNTLGNGQTLKSQGIIHGGTKYALLGKMTNAQRQIASMPSYWRDCLAGQGDVDLSATRVLADKHLIWAMPSLSNRITGFFASQLMQSHVATLPDSDKPLALRHPDCHGQFYALDEPVLDVHSLIETFTQQYRDFIFSDGDICLDTNTKVATFQKQKIAHSFSAQHIFITAGQGNAEFAPQQVRPLRMVSALVPKAFGALFLHVLEASNKPRLTVTSRYVEGNNDNRDNSDSPDNSSLLWYLGGNVAEKGATLSHEQTIDLARCELENIFPWLDFSDVVFDTHYVNRAEGLANGKRPDTPTIVDNGTHLIAWPTKLALAPMLADSLLATLYR